MYKEPTCLTPDGWQEWNRITRKDYPIQWFFRETLPDWFNANITYRISVGYQAIKYFLFPRNVIKCESVSKIGDDLSEMIFHGAFQCLNDFVDKKKALQRLDWSISHEHLEARYKITYLYNWYNSDYKIKLNEIDNEHDLSTCISKQHQLQLEIDKKLLDLMSIRNYIWI